MTTQYFSVPDGRIAYDEAGSGPLVVCVPGMGDVRASYRFLVPQLVAAGYRVATMDVRGHGETSVRWPDYSVAGVGSDIVALVRHLGGGSALVIGTSMAAGAAVWAAAEVPEAIAGLVLIGPFVRDMGPRWQARLMALIYGALFADPWGVAAWMRYFASLYPSRKPSDFPAYMAALRANLSEPGRLAALRAMIRASKHASEERLGKVRAPVLVLMGTRDPDFKDPAAEARLVAGHMQGSIQMIEGAGHYPHAEMPDVAGQAIVDLLHRIALQEKRADVA